MMRVAHVVPGLAEEASGPSYSVPQLALSLRELGVVVELHALSVSSTVTAKLPSHIYPALRFLPTLGVSPAMHRGLKDVAKRSQILHNHSLWMMPNIYPYLATQGTSCRMVVSPRGTLSQWALRRRRWLKQIIWSLGQGRVVREAHCLHATSESELQDIRRLGLRNPVMMIPNGIDIPTELVPRMPRDRKRLLFLGRIHPVKGVNDLLRAWRELQAVHKDWELVIAGPDNNGYRSDMEQLSRTLGNQRVIFAGPLFGQEKWAAYRNADLYILPSHSENFGITVAEALASETAVIVTQGAPWSGVESRGCGWWPKTGSDALKDALDAALRTPVDELRQMGIRGAVWMRDEFQWLKLAQKTLDVYQWLLGGGSPPSCVDTCDLGGSWRRAG